MSNKIDQTWRAAGGPAAWLGPEERSDPHDEGQAGKPHKEAPDKKKSTAYWWLKEAKHELRAKRLMDRHLSQPSTKNQ